MTDRVIYSFVVDGGRDFVYRGFQLSRSLCHRCNADPADVHVHFTNEALPHAFEFFTDCGYRTHHLQRFGDGRWCNKLAQLPNLVGEPFDLAVLLDTDMIAVADVRPFLRRDAVLGKIVDFPNPPLAVLEEIHRRAGGRRAPVHVRTDAVDTATFLGNCNGGFYAVPRALAASFSAEWRRWALWLFDNDEPLRRAGRLMNVDQVSAALTFAISKIPFAPACANLNYALHGRFNHHYFNTEHPIVFIHYHKLMGSSGLLETNFTLTPPEAIALAAANSFIEAGHANDLLGL